MERELAIDRAKLKYRQDGLTYHVVRMPEGEFDVLTEKELQEGLADESFTKKSIIFSVYGDPIGEEDV